MAKEKILIFILSVTSTTLPTSAYTECEFIQQTMNKLGTRMAILRATIASTADKTKQDDLSAQLSRNTAHYRLAKKQLEKANCPVE